MNDSLCMGMWECIKIEGFPPSICRRVLIVGEICQSTQRNKKYSWLLIGEGSEYRPFPIWGSCHKADRLSGGDDYHKVDRLSGGVEKQSTLRPCTCIKKWTFCFILFFCAWNLQKESSKNQKAQVIVLLGSPEFQRLPWHLWSGDWPENTKGTIGGFFMFEMMTLTWDIAVYRKRWLCNESPRRCCLYQWFGLGRKCLVGYSWTRYCPHNAVTCPLSRVEKMFPWQRVCGLSG